MSFFIFIIRQKAKAITTNFFFTAVKSKKGSNFNPEQYVRVKSFTRHDCGIDLLNKMINFKQISGLKEEAFPRNVSVFVSFLQSVLVESPVSLTGVISLDPSLSESSLSAPSSSVSPAVSRKGGAGGGGGGKKGKKKKDPNEPQKPVSAYALFFRDTQAAIKGQNPNATFGEVSKIVASMWDSLGEEQKQVRRISQ